MISPSDFRFDVARWYSGISTLRFFARPGEASFAVFRFVDVIIVAAGEMNMGWKGREVELEEKIKGELSNPREKTLKQQGSLWVNEGEEDIDVGWIKVQAMGIVALGVVGISMTSIKLVYARPILVINENASKEEKL